MHPDTYRFLKFSTDQVRGMLTKDEDYDLTWLSGLAQAENLIQTLEEADVVALTGEALSHCVANTVTDIANAFADPATIRKLVLITDATSNVGGFDFLGQQFVADMTKRGMRLETADSFLA